MMPKANYREATEALETAHLVLGTVAEPLAREGKAERAQPMRDARAAQATAILRLEEEERSAPADEVEAIAMPALMPGTTVDGFLAIAAAVEVERRQRQGAYVETSG